MKIEDIDKIIHALPYNETIISDEEGCDYAVMLPIVEKDGKLHVLFEKRSEHVSQPGEICFPGGRQDDKDEVFSETAIRETCEELGFLKSDMTLLGKLGVLATHHRRMIHCYVGFMRWEDVKDRRYNRKEVAELILMELEHLMKAEPKTYKILVKAQAYEEDEQGNIIHLFPARELGIPSYYHDEWDMGYRKIISYNLENIHIWGITGYILRHFIKTVSKNNSD